MARYVALLRGINVGGKNLVGMKDLKTCFEERGFRNVSTYIQSGNVLFEAPARKPRALVADLEELLSDTFDLAISVVLRSHQQLARIVADAPKGFGTDPGRFRYDVLFLKDPLAASEAMESVTTRDGVDEATAGKGVLYFSRLASRATQSHLSRLAGKPVYKRMTVRNWNTTTKILALMDAGAAAPSR